MGMQLAFRSALVSVCASTASALGPTATDWRDSAGACGAPDSKTSVPFWTPVRLNAIHGRSRPNGGTVLTDRAIFAVGDAGNIIQYTPAGWAQMKSPTTENLNAIYVYPPNQNVTVGTDQVAGWAVGTHGTILRLTENTPGVYDWKCEACPTDCGATWTMGGGGQLNLCSTLYDVFPVDDNDSKTPVFLTGQAQCRWFPDLNYPPSNGDAATLFFFAPGTTMWQEAVGNTWNTPDPGAYYIGDGSWPGKCACGKDVWYTGVISKVSGSAGGDGGIFDSGNLRVSVGLTGLQWGDFSSKFMTNMCGYEPRYYTSAMFGNWALIMGDAANGACWNHYSLSGSMPGAVNTFVYKPAGGNPIFAVDSGLSGTKDATWGTVRKLASLPAWGFGIAVGHGASTGADGAMDQAGTAPDAYFALVKWADTNRLVKPEDPSSPNEILYQQEPACAGGGWPGMNGVFISAYNEAWAVGENGKILHWVGPIVQPAALKCSLSVSPTGAIPAGSQFSVVVSVTNTGEAGLADLVVDLGIQPTSGVAVQCGPFCSTIWYDGTNCAGLQSTPCAASLPPSGPAYFTWIYQVTGCGTGLSFAVTATGTDLLNNVPVSAITGYNIGSNPLALSVTSWHSPAPLVPGSPVSFTTVVTNVGGATAQNLLFVDTLPPGVQGLLALDMPPGFAFGSTGTTVWMEAGAGIELNTGQSWTFTITGTYPVLCASVTVYHAGWARADDGCGTVYPKASAPDKVVLPGLSSPSLTVASTHLPLAPAAGSTVIYSIVVTNTGTATLTTLVIVDTSPAALDGVVGIPPPGFWQVANWNGTSTVFIWGSPTTIFPPLSTTTFTVTGVVPSKCTASSAQNTAWARGSTACTVVQGNAPVDSFTIGSSTQPSLTVQVSHNAGAKAVGDPIVYTITVHNSGAATISDLLVVDTMPATLAAPAEDVTPPPFVFASSGRVFSWYASGLSFFPGTDILFTASAYLSSGCAAGALSNSAWARTMSVCGFSQAVSPPDQMTVPGQVTAGIAIESQQEIPGRYRVIVSLTVSDTGASWVDGILPSADLVITPAGPETVKQGGPLPPSYPDAVAWYPTCTSANPCCVTFQWTYLSSTVTPISITASASAVVCPPFSTSPTGCAAQGGSVCTVSATTSTFFADTGGVGDLVLDRNLFRGRTESLTVSFILSETTRVSVVVYNSVGQKVKTLYKGQAGRRMQELMTWNGTNDQGERCASGAYFIRLETPHWVKTRKVALLK